MVRMVTERRGRRSRNAGPTAGPWYVVKNAAPQVRAAGRPFPRSHQLSKSFGGFIDVSWDANNDSAQDGFAILAIQLHDGNVFFIPESQGSLTPGQTRTLQGSIEVTSDNNHFIPGINPVVLEMYDFNNQERVAFHAFSVDTS